MSNILPPMTDAWEAQARAEGFALVCGCDEAGRGPLAGPVAAAAVLLPPGFYLEGLNDSKKLSARKRERLYDEITQKAQAWAVAYASAAEIDEINILQASMLAMRRAVELLPIQPDLLLIDGPHAMGFRQPARPVIRGDAQVPSIAAASILAKVSRDRICEQMDRDYPGYGFAQHKGYPTAAHYEAIRTLGPTPEHRRSFRLFQS